jgi:hypothetical protein
VEARQSGVLQLTINQIQASVKSGVGAMQDLT